MADVADFEDADICVVCPYTYDEGALPEEGLDFYDDLKEADLSGKIYGVAGSGDTFYADPSTSTSPRRVTTSTRWTPLPPAWLKRRRANNGRLDCPVAEV